MGFLSMLGGDGGASSKIRREPRLLAAAESSSPADSFQTGGPWHEFSLGGPSRTGMMVNERTTLSLPAVMQAIRILSGVFAIVNDHIEWNLPRNAILVGSCGIIRDLVQ